MESDVILFTPKNLYQWEGYRDVIYGGRGSKVIKLLFNAL